MATPFQVREARRFPNRTLSGPGTNGQRDVRRPGLGVEFARNGSILEANGKERHGFGGKYT